MEFKCSGCNKEVRRFYYIGPNLIMCAGCYQANEKKLEQKVGDEVV
jgi:hypothetical protein